MAKKEQPPVMFLELCEKRNSGFVKQGTEGTAFHEELNCPNILWVPSSGYKAVVENLDGVETVLFKEIRWIKNCNTIDKDEQDRRGIKPNRMEDKIPFEKGFATVVREGSTASLYDYLKSVFYSEDAEHRPSTAEAVYRVLQLDKKAEDINEADIEMADAIKLVSELRVKTGDSETPYKYNEQRIDLICELCQVFAETYPTKLLALMALAKNKPRWFLDLVMKFEQTLITEVTHALQLKVVRFDGNTALYIEDDKVIRSLGAGNLKQTTKVQMLAEYLGSKEGTEALTELRTKIEIAKENSLK